MDVVYPNYTSDRPRMFKKRKTLGQTPSGSKSPIISPEIESGTPPYTAREILRDPAIKPLISPRHPKPRPRPESPVSPRNPARQQIPPSDQGGIAPSISRRKSGLLGLS